MPAFPLCLLWVLATAAQAAPVAHMGSPEPAQYEDLTLLFHGTLQLGQGLNSVYRNTEQRLTEAKQSLGLYSRAVELLGLQVSQGQKAAQELRTDLVEIQMDQDTLQLQAEAAAQELAEAAQAQQVLRDRVRRLDGQLRGVWLGRARHELETLKAYADKQSHLMWVLEGHMHRQRQQMAAQQQWLRQIRQIRRLHTAARPA